MLLITKLRRGLTQHVRHASNKQTNKQKQNNNNNKYIYIWPRLCSRVTITIKLHTLVYDILPPSTVILDYVIGLENLSANGQFFVDAQKGCKFVTVNSNYMRRFFITAHVAYTRSDKTEIV